MKHRAALGASLAIGVALAVTHASGPPASASASAAWVPMSKNVPDRRRAAAVYLPSPTCKILLFGGVGPDGTPAGETFLYNPSTDQAGESWTELRYRNAASPVAASHTALTWDPSQSLAVLFGGFSGVSTNRVSLFDPRTLGWTLLDNRRCTASTCPGARYAHAQVWSNDVQATLVFGGKSTASSPHPTYSDLWALKLSKTSKGGVTQSWTKITPTGVPGGTFPESRSYHGMVELPAVNGVRRILVFGGLSADGTLLGDTWLLTPSNGYQFEEVVGPSPGPRTAFAMGYSLALGMAVLHGGSGPESGSFPLNDTWGFNYGTKSWVLLAGDGPMKRRSLHDMAFDPSGSCGDRAFIVEAPYDRQTDVAWYVTR